MASLMKYISRQSCYFDGFGAIYRIGNIESIEKGETYVNLVRSGAVKGWRKHLVADITISCILGSVMIEITDDKYLETVHLSAPVEAISPEIINLRVLSGSWFRIASTHYSDSLLLCQSTERHNPAEVVRR